MNIRKQRKKAWKRHVAANNRRDNKSYFPTDLQRDLAMAWMLMTRRKR